MRMSNVFNEHLKNVAVFNFPGNALNVILVFSATVWMRRVSTVIYQELYFCLFQFSLFSCLEKKVSSHLQQVLNSAARLLPRTNEDSYNSLSEGTSLASEAFSHQVLCFLFNSDWEGMGSNFLIEFKTLVLNFRALICQLPTYIQELLCPFAVPLKLPLMDQDLLMTPLPALKGSEIIYPTSLRSLDSFDVFTRHPNTH